MRGCRITFSFYFAPYGAWTRLDEESPPVVMLATGDSRLVYDLVPSAGLARAWEPFTALEDRVLGLCLCFDGV